MNEPEKQEIIDRQVKRLLPICRNERIVPRAVADEISTRIERRRSRYVEMLGELRDINAPQTVIDSQLQILRGLDNFKKTLLLEQVVDILLDIAQSHDDLSISQFSLVVEERLKSMNDLLVSSADCRLAIDNECGSAKISEVVTFNEDDELEQLSNDWIQQRLEDDEYLQIMEGIRSGLLKKILEEK